MYSRFVKRIVGACAFAFLLAASSIAHADTAGAAKEPWKQSLGVGTGLSFGLSGTSPGGFSLLGNYLYQLRENQWFEGALVVAYGAGSPACFRNRENEKVCRHGPLKGASTKLMMGVRFLLQDIGRYSIFLNGGTAITINGFRGDEIQGFSIPLWMGGVLHIPLKGKMRIVTMTMLELGLAWYNKNIGVSDSFALTLIGGIEFSL